MTHTHLDHWSGAGVTIPVVERELGALREAAAADDVPDLRTSVMTHIAWVPEEWVPAATETLAGLAERHPSRAILLIPDPDAGEDRLDAEVSLRCFPVAGATRLVCAEVIQLRLRGRRAFAPASIVTPLLISDLPVFLRWRGRPGFGATEFGQLADVADRLVVDSSEWPDLPHAYAELAGVFDRAAVSDIAWSRTLPWRTSLAGLWPAIAHVREIRVAGPRADALLLAGWLRARLARDIRLVHDEADEVELVAVDGEPMPAPRGERLTASDLLSAELDRFGRDPVFEQAVRAAA